MINPSATGWIEKYFTKVSHAKMAQETLDTFYERMRKSGFIYGHVVDYEKSKSSLGLTLDEKCKLALLEALYGIYQLEIGQTQAVPFIELAINFYQSIQQNSSSKLPSVFKTKATQLLEEIIDERIATNQDIVSKHFSHIVTNALLFIDVLAFQRFLKNVDSPSSYIRKLETCIISVVSLAIKTKVTTTAHDDLLIKLLEASLRYSKYSTSGINTIEDSDLGFLQFTLEKYYLIDLAGMVLWRDDKIENDEMYFLQKLAELLGVEEVFVRHAVASTQAFLVKHYDEIPYFHYSHPVKHFYDNLSQSVIVLLTRNKKRLVKEISQSKELMVLLAKSTQRDLDAKEKKQIKAQMLEICRTIPSLTIFLLPGGSLLLPLLIKFIPQLMPHAFNENLDQE